MECGICEDTCSATASGKPLSPNVVIADLRNVMSSGGKRSRVDPRETLWACTMCQACVQECPVLIGHIDLISDMRRYLMGEGKLSGLPWWDAATDRKPKGNPYGRPNSNT